MRFETAEVDRYGPLAGCRPPCGDGVTVVAGPNESGKTLYLEAVLQLLEPDVAEYMPGGPRVDAAPAGRVVVVDGDERHALGDGTCLSDVSRVAPRHLYNLFVVRDSDLVLPEGPEYYTSLVEHLGDIHTSAIESIRAELVAEGRLTETRLNLANREYDTEDCRAEAAALAEEVEAYLGTLEERGTSEAVRERLRLRSELSRVEADLATQRTAGDLAALEDASEQYETYVEATESLRELAGFDRGTLEELRELSGDLEHARERIEAAEASLAREREEAERCREELATARDRLAELEAREPDVQQVEAALAAYRDRASADDGGFEERLALRRHVAVAGVVGGGLAAAGGAVAGSSVAFVVAALCLLVAAAAGLANRRLADRAADAAALERELLEGARDAGFEVAAPADVAPLLGEFENDLERAGARANRLEARYEELDGRVDDLEAELEAAESRADDLRGRLEAVLDDRGVDTIEAYEARVQTREGHERDRSDAELVLERAVGEPDADDPAERIAHWEAELEEWRADLGDPAVDADRYDEAELERLEARAAELEERLRALEAELAEYQDQLDEFERRAEAVSPPPFVDVDPSLAARTDEGLRDLAADLRTVVETIERNAEVSRRAVNIFDGIRDDEEGKVATLFDPEGPASETFAHLTDGRYEAVDYDPEAETLAVTAADGGTLTPRQLSRGTRDQLYLAARLSLAEQLLDGGSGFLLLDDPFLAADPTRLRNGFETLQGLCEDGWQVIYLTAKPEVHEEMATEFDCPVYELAPLEF
jgi:DNA repair exonuclease SbcCD ATPase subunit